MKRRQFLILTSGFALGATFSINAKNLPAVVIKPDEKTGLSASQWHTMDVVLKHFFPSEPDSPGATEIHATAWLHNALKMPDVDAGHRKVMHDGIVKLDKISQSLYKKSFIHLDELMREATLRELEKDREGHIWIKETMRYILEALLIDPVYGANPGGIGWKWLKHRPGFPLPPENKKYYML